MFQAHILRHHKNEDEFNVKQKYLVPQPLRTVGTTREGEDEPSTANSSPDNFMEVENEDVTSDNFELNSENEEEEEEEKCDDSIPVPMPEDTYQLLR